MADAPGRSRLLAILAVGMLSTSFGSIFVKWAAEAPSLTIAFYRMASAVVVLTPFYGFRRVRAGRGGPSASARRAPQPFRLERAHLLAGLALALHFAFWVSSLRFTSVAVSTLMVTTSPVLVAIIAYLALGERTSGVGLAGILISFLGAGLLLYGDLRVGDWRGPVLALAGAVMVAVYWVIGRNLRRRARLLGYVYPVYLSAALALALIVWVLGLQVSGFSTTTVLALLAAGIVPQCLGHTAYNWALAHLPATTVSTLVLAEPILASLLAYWLLGESLGGLVLAGGGLVATGILMVSIWGKGSSGPRVLNDGNSRA